MLAKRRVRLECGDLTCFRVLCEGRQFALAGRGGMQARKGHSNRSDRLEVLYGWLLSQDEEEANGHSSAAACTRQDGDSKNVRRQATGHDSRGAWALWDPAGLEQT